MNILELATISTIAREKCTISQVASKLAKKGLKKGVNYANIRRILEQLIKKGIAKSEWNEGQKVYSSTQEKLKEILNFLEI